MKNSSSCLHQIIMNVLIYNNDLACRQSILIESHRLMHGTCTFVNFVVSFVKPHKVLTVHCSFLWSICLSMPLIVQQSCLQGKLTRLMSVQNPLFVVHFRYEQVSIYIDDIKTLQICGEKNKII